MNIIGIIIETNPFHNGHQYFINEIKRIYHPDLLVAVTSTSFTMRGEVSVLNKFDKTKALLNGGIDVVLEFPFILSTQSSDYFALNAVTILNTFGVNQIVCGCENDNLEFLHQLFEIENSIEFENAFKTNLQNYKSYKQTYELTFKETPRDIFSGGFFFYLLLQRSNFLGGEPCKLTDSFCGDSFILHSDCQF